jgi:hypothetical protein
MSGLVSRRRKGKQVFYSLAPGVTVSNAKGKSTITIETDDRATVREARPA